MSLSLQITRRGFVRAGAIEAMDIFRHQAFDLATNPQVQETFDLNKVDDATRERYDKQSGHRQGAVLARRLVARGARLVNCRRASPRAWRTTCSGANSAASRASTTKPPATTGKAACPILKFERPTPSSPSSTTIRKGETDHAVIRYQRPTFHVQMRHGCRTCGCVRAKERIRIGDPVSKQFKRH